MTNQTSQGAMDASEAADQPPNTDRDSYSAQVSEVRDSIVVQGHNSVVTVGGLHLESTEHGPAMIAFNGEIIVSRRQEVPKMIQKRPELLDRERERALCNRETPGMIELFGDLGIGKSSLLALLAYDLRENNSDRFSDGMAYLSAAEHSLEELLFDIWGLFFEVNVPWVVQPSVTQMRLQLRDMDSLLLLDEPILSEDELRSLDSALPGSVVAITHEDSTAGGFARSVYLGDLPAECLIALATKQFLRMGVPAKALSDAEIEAILEQSEGNALKCLRAAAKLARDRLKSHTTERETSVMHAIQAFSKPVPEDLLAALTMDKGAPAIAEEMVQQGLLEAHSPSYTHPWPDELMTQSTLQELNERALEHLVTLDLRAREDARAVSLEVLGWWSRQPGTEVAVHLGLLERLAHLLSDAYMTSGCVDRWKEVGVLASVVGSATDDHTLTAWGERTAGAAALCRGERMEARDRLESAVSIYSTQGDHEALLSCLAILQVALTSSDDPEDGDSSGSSGSSDPLVPNMGAGGSGWDTQSSGDAQSMQPERELVST